MDLALLYFVIDLIFEAARLATPFWYNTVLFLIKPVYKWRIKKRAENMQQLQAELIERFGPFQPAKNRQAIWFHAVSVGETNAAQPLIEHYLQQGHAVLVTNTTKTGQARVKSLFLQTPYQYLFQAVYLPADQISLVRQFFQHYQPKLLALVETELWPNLIDQAQQFNVPCILINARLSEKSARGYAKVPQLTQTMLQQLSALLAQDQATLTRFLQLGMPKNKAHVIGSIKFDITVPPAFLQQAQQLRQQWQLAQRHIMILASTHAPEEQQLLTALKPYFARHPQLLCIVVPRHPERFDAVFQLCQQLSLRTQRRSLNQHIQSDTQVYLADSMGEMWLWYALSQACFVGGSLNEPGGGHNILEPIALDVPTVVGKNYLNFQTIVDEFVAADALKVAMSAEQAIEYLIQFLFDPVLAQQITTHAQQIMQRNQGALQKYIDAMDQYLQQKH